jgi:redox-sensitive bicupin YhaK (pirin superfamily)
MSRLTCGPAAETRHPRRRLPGATPGRYGSAVSKITAPSPINYLAVSLNSGEHWKYQPPEQHTVAWTAVSRGSLRAPEAPQAGELALFEESNAANAFDGETDVELVVGSAVKHPHDLVLGHYSVHTSAEALREGEARIQQIDNRLRAEGRLT